MLNGVVLEGEFEVDGFVELPFVMVLPLDVDGTVDEVVEAV